MSRTAMPAGAAWTEMMTRAAEGTPYSQEYLGLLARTGRLEAIKRGRNWYTTAAAIGRYCDSLNRRPIQPMERHK